MIQLIASVLAGKTVIVVTHRDKIREICNREYLFCNNRMEECRKE